MDVSILRQDKDEIEISVENLTIAEVLRVYLNEVGVEFSAWSRGHPSKPANLLIKSDGKSIKKVVSEAVDLIKKDCNSVLSAIKK